MDCLSCGRSPTGTNFCHAKVPFNNLIPFYLRRLFGICLVSHVWDLDGLHSYDD